MAIRVIYNYYHHVLCYLSIRQVWKKYDCYTVSNGKNGILLKFVTFPFASWNLRGSSYLQFCEFGWFLRRTNATGIFTLHSQLYRNFTLDASVYSSNHWKYKILGIHNMCWYLDEGIFWKARSITTAVLNKPMGEGEGGMIWENSIKTYI